MWWYALVGNSEKAVAGGLQIQGQPKCVAQCQGLCDALGLIPSTVENPQKESLTTKRHNLSSQSLALTASCCKVSFSSCVSLANIYSCSGKASKIPPSSDLPMVHSPFQSLCVFHYAKDMDTAGFLPLFFFFFPLNLPCLSNSEA